MPCPGAPGLLPALEGSLVGSRRNALGSTLGLWAVVMYQGPSSWCDASFITPFCTEQKGGAEHEGKTLSLPAEPIDHNMALRRGHFEGHLGLFESQEHRNGAKGSFGKQCHSGAPKGVQPEAVSLHPAPCLPLQKELPGAVCADPSGVGSWPMPGPLAHSCIPMELMNETNQWGARAHC